MAIQREVPGKSSPYDEWQPQCARLPFRRPRRGGFGYPKREGGDEALRQRLRELAGERRRFGYRRLGILLAREGLVANHKKL